MKNLRTGEVVPSRAKLESVIGRLPENSVAVCIPRKDGFEIHGVTSCAHELECLTEGANIVSDNQAFTIGSMS